MESKENINVNGSDEGEDVNGDNSERIQKQMDDLLNEKDLKEYIYLYIKTYDEKELGFTVFKMMQSAYKLLKKFVKNKKYEQKYNLLLKLSNDDFEKFFGNATISKDLADVILLAWVHCRQSRIPRDKPVRGFDKSLDNFKTLYSDDASPTGMVYFLSVFAEASLSIMDVKQVLSVQKYTEIYIDDAGNLGNWLGYQPTEKTFTVVLKAIESLSYNWKLTKNFMDVICKILDFEALNDKLKFNDISKIDNEVLEEINRFYAVICNTILHNRLDNKKGEQALGELGENDFYAIFNLKETEGTLINFWKKINGASQDPKDNSFYRLLKIDVINKLAENEKNTHAVQLKKLVGNGNILKSLGVKIEDQTNEINKSLKIKSRLTQTKNKEKVLIWKNLILILAIALSALASLLFGMNIKFLFLAFITNPLSMIITVVAVILFISLAIYANKVKAIRLEKLYCGKKLDGKSFFNIYKNIDDEIPNSGKDSQVVLQDKNED